MTIDATSDGEGLRQAVSELLEQGYAQARSARSFEGSDDEGRERIFGSLPALTLSPGYYRRAECLVWLERAKKAGLINGEFTLDEAEGLIAVNEARADFERNHPPCGICGALQESTFATSCCKCGTEFMKRGA